MTSLLSDAAISQLDAFLKNVPDEFCRSLAMSSYSRIKEQMEIDSELPDDFWTLPRDQLWYSFGAFRYGCKGMLEKVRSSDRKVKESFLFALHSCRPDLLKSIGATLPRELSLAAKDECVQLGGFSYRKHTLGFRLNQVLDKLLREKSRVGMVFIGRHVLTFIDQLFTKPHWDKARPYSFRNSATVYDSLDVFGVSVAKGFREATLAFAGKTDEVGFRKAALACFEKMKKLAGVQFDVVAFLDRYGSVKECRSFLKVLAEEFGTNILRRCFGSEAGNPFADDEVKTIDEETVQAVASFENFTWKPCSNCAVVYSPKIWRLGFWIGVLKICASQVFGGIFIELRVGQCQNSWLVSDMPSLNRDPEAIYAEAVIAGSVIVNRCRVLVVGKDGSGKSCLVDSFLARPFQADRPSTIGAAVSLVVTSTQGWLQVKSKDVQHLENYILDGLASTDRQQGLAASKDDIPFENLWYAINC